MKDYWRDCIAEAFEESKIEATAEQIDNVAAWAESAHENYRMATGDDVADANLSASREREKGDLLKALHREQDKVTCRKCKGRGHFVEHYGSRSSEIECWECHGAGRHDP